MTSSNSPTIPNANATMSIRIKKIATIEAIEDITKTIVSITQT